MSHIPLIEQFKSSIGSKKPARTASRRCTRSPFKSNFAGKRQTPEAQPSGIVLEPVLLTFKQPQVSFDFRATQTRRNSASPNKRRARSTREAEIEQQPSFSVIDFYPDQSVDSKHQSPQKIVLPRLPIVKCEPQFCASDLLSSKTRSRFTYESEDAAPSSKQSAGTTRLFWRRRTELKRAPLLVVNFEGVIGDVAFDGTTHRLLVREGLIRASTLLSDRFQLAVLFSHPRKRSRRLLSELLDLGLDLDAAYKRRCDPKCPDFLTDYTQVIADFSASEVVVVGTLRLDQGEVLRRTDFNLVYECSASLRNRVQVRGCPTTACGTFLLVPSLLAQENFLCPSLDAIAALLLKLWKLSLNRGGLEAVHDLVSRISMGELRKVEVRAQDVKCGLGSQLLGIRTLVLVHSRMTLKRCSSYDKLIY